MPAYRFVRFDYIPPVSAEHLGRITEAMRHKEGFFLTASLKQDRRSRGTLLALEGPGAAHRQFEIVSNGPADTLDLTYWVDGTQHVISLEDVGLADSQWKNVTVQVTGETYSLYVGCDLMDSFTLDEPFYEHLQTERSRMYVAKGAARESHFRVGPADTPTRPGWGGAGSWGVHMGRRERKEHPRTPAGTCTHFTHAHCPHAHTCTHCTHVHTCTHYTLHTHTCTYYTHAHCAHTHTCTHVYTCTHYTLHTHTPAHTILCTHTYIAHCTHGHTAHTHMHACTLHTCTQAQALSCAHTHTLTQEPTEQWTQAPFLAAQMVTDLLTEH